MSVIVAGPKLPDGYSVHQLTTGSGRRYRATNGKWSGPVRHTVIGSVDDAYDHFYAMTGAKPVLRMEQGGRVFLDVVSGHRVTQEQVLAAGSYSAAFRLKAEEKRLQADHATFLPLRELLLNIADQLDEVATRMEVRSGRH